jgi:hypothetical protein
VSCLQPSRQPASTSLNLQHTGTKAAGQLHAILLGVQGVTPESMPAEQHHNAWDLLPSRFAGFPPSAKCRLRACTRTTADPRSQLPPSSQHGILKSVIR